MSKTTFPSNVDLESGEVRPGVDVPESQAVAVIDATEVDEDTLAAPLVGNAVDVMISELRKPESATYSSIVVQSQADVVRTMKALTNSRKLVDEKGVLFDGIISLVDVIVQKVEFIDDAGKAVIAPRVTLIDADGTSFHGTSAGLVGALRTFFAVAGEPHEWDGAIYQIRVERQLSRRGFFFFTIVFA